MEKQTLQHTPAPWRWEINLQYKAMQLVGGVPRFDKTIMSFKRWGTQGATVMFQDKEKRFLTEAKDFAQIVEGREHYADWFQTINHPDANLIAAAPDLLAALIKAEDYIRRDLAVFHPEVPENHVDYILKDVTAAIKKATNPQK